MLAFANAPHRNQLVVVAHVDGDDAVPTAAVVRLDGRLLHHAVSRGEQQVLVGREVARGDDRGDPLVIAEGKQIHDRRPARVSRANRQLVHLQAIDLAAAREEEYVVVRRADEQVLDEIALLQAHARDALAATLLLAVRGHRQPLDVSGLGDRDDHVLLGDQVLDVEVAGHTRELGAPRVRVLLPNLAHLVLDDLQHQRHVAENPLIPGDLLAQLGELLLDLGALQAGQAAQAHLEDRVRLCFRQAEALNKAGFRLHVVGARLDDGDDLVDVVERDDVALEDVGALLGLAQVVPGAAEDDFLLVLHVVEEHVLQRQLPRHAVDECELDDADARLERGVLVELVHDHLRDHALLELDDHAHALAIGLVAQVGDLRQLLLANQFGDLENQLGLVHRVGDLGDDDPHPAGRRLLGVCLPTHLDRSATRLVRRHDALAAHDHAAGREVRSRDVLHQAFGGDLRIVDERARGVDHLTQVVREDVRGHTHRDTGRAVDEQVREPRR